MKTKEIIISAVALLTIIAVVICIVATQSDCRVKIDEWSQNLVTDKIELAVISKNYGVNTRRYTLTPEEYDELITLLSDVTEKNIRKKLPSDASKTDCRLELYYDGSLWLFNCYDYGAIVLVFESETAEHYGYNGAVYFNIPDLCDYIMDKAENEAE